MRNLIVHNIVWGLAAFLLFCGVFILFTFDLENPRKWALLIILVFGGFLAIFFEVFARYKKRSTFANRTSLSMDEIYARHYASSGLPKNVVLELWQNVAKILQIPAEKLRPTDEFDKELGPYHAIGDNLEELEHITLCKLKESNATVDFSKIKTLDDYIRCFCPISISGISGIGDGSN